MDRIVVIGCGGSGKSVIARTLGDALGLPIVHLDGLYYDEEWNTLTPDDFAHSQYEVVAKPHWIIDGNYASTLPIRLAAADTVIFLDLGAATCLWGIARRRVRYGGGQHPDVGVYDRINRHFLRYVIRYRRDMGPRVRTLVTEHAPDANFHAPTSRRQVRRLIDELTTSMPATT
jgi:adenylate kinase family enzyme